MRGALLSGKGARINHKRMWKVLCGCSGPEVFRKIMRVGKTIQAKTLSDLREKIKDYSSVRKNGCWEWNRYSREDGRGQVRFRGVIHYAYKASYWAFIKKPTKGLHIHHNCENPNCVNPAHLIELTRAEHSRLHRVNYIEYEEKVLSKITIKTEAECWNWNGRIGSNRSPVWHPFNFEEDGCNKDSTTTARRIIWEIKIKTPLPKRIYKTCKNKFCCNPRHLTGDIAYHPLRR